MRHKPKHYKAGPVKDLFGQIVGWQHSKKDICILRADKSEVDRIVARHHYSKKPCTNSFCSLVVMYRGGLCGAVQIGYGIRPKKKEEGVVCWCAGQAGLVLKATLATLATWQP